MFVACIALKLPDRTVQAGDPIPEAEHWSAPVLRSNLNLGWIKKVEQSQVATIVPEPKRTKKKKR